MSNKLGTFIGLLVLLAGGAGVYYLFQAEPAVQEEAEADVETVVPVEVAKIRQATLRECLRTYGSVVPNPGTAKVAPASAPIGSPLDGIVTEVRCVAGQDVKKGQILFALYDRPARLALEQAEKDLAFAQENFLRQEKLQRVQGTSAKLHQEAQQQLDSARNRLGLVRAESELLQVTAPFDGTIMDVGVGVGQAVSRAGVLAVLTDLGQLVVKAGIPSVEAGKLRLGQRVEIQGQGASTSSDANAPSWVSRVDYVDSRVDPNNDTVAVLAGLPVDANLRPGQFVRVRIIVEEHRDRLVVPEESIVTTPEGQTVVAVVQGDEATPTPVRRGVSEDGWVAVEGQGLEPGMTVVTVGAYGLPGKTKIRMMGR